MTSVLEVRRFDDQDALDRAVAERLLDACTRPAPPECAAVMLTGGGTPRRAYARAAAEGGVAHAELRILYTDERYVPIDSDASNYRGTVELIDALQLPEPRRLRVRTELPLQQAADDYDARLEHLHTDGIGIGLGILGLGADGHIASLFSTAHLEHGRERLAIAVRRPDGRDAVSVTPRLLARVKHPLFVVAGADKRAAVDALIRRDPTLVAWQALAGCDRVELWVDADAHPQERVQP
jgi:6-phosphogluconolactonase/glucosamine-6-phosphate isomerase/deaminase